jgi:hypothetical protein
VCLPDSSYIRGANHRLWAFDRHRWAVLDGVTLARVGGELPVGICADKAALGFVL